METAVDPVCGMTVDVTPDAITSQHAGHTYYFCSEGCKKRFERDPKPFLAAAGHAHEGHAHG
jgi:Cu+-exporting ATPase